MDDTVRVARWGGEGPGYQSLHHVHYRGCETIWLSAGPGFELREVVAVGWEMGFQHCQQRSDVWAGGLLLLGVREGGGEWGGEEGENGGVEGCGVGG